jgi:hypothetical protein
MELNNMEGCISSKIIEARYEFDPVVKRLCELEGTQQELLHCMEKQLHSKLAT